LSSLLQEHNLMMVSMMRRNM